MKTTAKAFLDTLENQGFNFFCGVPCSIFKKLIKVFDEDPAYGYIPVVREDAAIGLAGGAYMGGKTPAVFMQNSGLGTSLTALTSLSLIYDFPCLMMISWRGYLGNDAPEHLIMGDIIEKLTELMGVHYEILEPGQHEEQIARLTQKMNETKKPVALIVRKGVVS